jgi:hypothetical protein
MTEKEKLEILLLIESAKAALLAEDGPVTPVTLTEFLTTLNLTKRSKKK